MYMHAFVGMKGEPGESVTGDPGDPGRKGEPGMKGEPGDPGTDGEWSTQLVSLSLSSMLSDHC